MPRTIEGQPTGNGSRIAIAASRFNDEIVAGLIAGAVDALQRHGVAADAITIMRCPGAWELPFIVQRLARSKNYDAVIALGCVIRGETAHFDYIAGEAARGLAAVMLETDVPVLNGLLATNNTEQAVARSGPTNGNKGAEAAMAALELYGLLEQL